jgi:acyl-CoA thioester hydrolase
MEAVLGLGPACLRMVVPDAYRDRNGHTNMRWYLAIFDDAGDTLQVRLGLTPEYHHDHITGTFDLEHHLHYLNEVLPGDRVAVYARLIALSAKRLHYLMFMVNETRATVAATLECMTAFVDLKVRRTAVFPTEIAATIDKVVAAHAALGWDAPLCGAMRA